jgi:alkaline phosphatase D
LPEDDWNRNVGPPDWLESDSFAYEFLHGVASGDPTKTSLIIWTRITPSEEVNDSTLIPVWFEVQDVSCSVVVSGQTYTNAHVDFTVKLDIQCLSPSTSYSYWFYGDGLKSQTSHTRTLPDDDNLDPLRLAVYSCANYAGGFYHAYRMPVIKGTVDYIVHLGDYIYEYASGVYTNVTHLGRDHKPEHECETSEYYRIRYALYRSDRDLQDSHARFPWILVWDDHEVTYNS